VNEILVLTLCGRVGALFACNEMCSNVADWLYDDNDYEVDDRTLCQLSAQLSQSLRSSNHNLNTAIALICNMQTIFAPHNLRRCHFRTSVSKWRSLSLHEQCFFSFVSCACSTLYLFRCGQYRRSLCTKFY